MGKKKKIVKQINALKTNAFFFFGVMWLTAFGIFSLSKSIINDSDVKGASTFVFNEVNENYLSKYVSNPLGIEFIYDNRLFTVSEKENYLNLSPTDKDLPFFNASIRTEKESKIAKLFPNLNYIETVNSNGVEISLFTFVKPSFSKNEESNVDYLTVIHKPLSENKTVYLSIWGYDYVKDPKVTEFLTKLVDSISDLSSEEKISEVLSATTSAINKAQILGQASTVRIYGKECNNVKFSNNMNGLNIQGKSYTICSTGFGSGFVINDNGQVVTNAHVVNIDNLDSLIEGTSIDGTFEEDFLADLIDYFSTLDKTALSQATEDEILYFVTSLIVDLNKEGYITITDKDREIYIQGESIFKNDPESGELLEKDKYFKATLIESTPLTSYYQSLLSDDTAITEVADLAVLQVEGSFNLPSIPINTTGFSIGQTIYVVGYPVIADDAELISNTQVLSSSVTKGSISSIKPNTNNTFDLVQIDAAIQGGNSGGPILDEDGDVVAVATYSISSDSGNYNYGVSSKELLTFLNNSAVEPQVNSLRINLEKTLSDVTLSYYKKAKISLEEILIAQPNLTVTLQPIVDLCQERIDAGDDKTPLFDINGKILMVIILVILVLLLVVSTVFLILNMKKISEKKKQLSQIPNIIN